MNIILKGVTYHFCYYTKGRTIRFPLIKWFRYVISNSTLELHELLDFDVSSIFNLSPYKRNACISDAVSYTKIEAKNFNKYYQYGSIREPSFTSSHSVTNCGEIWSAYNAILDGAKFKDLSFQSVYSRSGAYLDMCENCQHTFIEFLKN